MLIVSAPTLRGQPQSKSNDSGFSIQFTIPRNWVSSIRSNNGFILTFFRGLISGCGEAGQVERIKLTKAVVARGMSACGTKGEDGIGRWQVSATGFRLAKSGATQRPLLASPICVGGTFGMP